MKTIATSNYCQECVGFRQKKCKGKPDKIETKLWGQKLISRKTGLNFCSQYEFDIRLYKFSDGSIQTQSETIKEIRERQIRKEIEQIQKQINEATCDETTCDETTCDVIEIEENLRSEDFADLI